MRRALPFALLAVLAAACIAPPQTKPTAPQDYYLHATPERVWNALLLVYTDLNIPIENMDRASWFMRSQDMALAHADARDWLDCGTNAFGIPVAGASAVSMNITTLLRPAGDSTAMRLAVHLQGTIDAGFGPQALTCVSRGVLEQRVVERVRERL